MSDLLINPVKKSDPHVLTFAPLRVVFKTCDHLATTAGFVSRLKLVCLIIIIRSNECRKPSHDETKVFKNIMNVLLTLTYSVFLDKPVNVALAVEHRIADLEERYASA